MPKPTSKTVVHEVKGHGFQKRLALLDPETRQTRGFLIGGVPFAQVPQRFSRAKALTSQEYQFGSKNSPVDFAHFSNECPQPMKANNVSEDCLQSNIWIPNANPPRDGWPVLVFIHGGFLAWGANSAIEPSTLLTEDSPVKAVIVAPNYRLNTFGFIASSELSEEARSSGEETGNMGFWDQRLALEWIYQNIHLYGGNPNNITLSGLSAGAYSTFHQLAYEVGLPDSEAIIKRVTMFSNGCGLQPKPFSEVQSHFENLLKALNIPLELSSKDKLQRLRSASADAIVDAVKRIPENSFRATTDGKFIRESLFEELTSGSFAKVLERRGVKLMLGECCDEKNSYRLNSPPSSYESLISRLAVEYREDATRRIVQYNCPDKKLPFGYKSWQDIFGQIYADFQVHAGERGLMYYIYPTVPVENISRYRIEWRTKSTDKVFPPDMGVCHASDMQLWFRGNGLPLTLSEQKIAQEWLEPWGAFIRGEDKIGWGTGEIGQYRLLSASGEITPAIDKHYKHGRRHFDAAFKARRESKL